MELKVPSGRVLWHFYIYLCSAWVVMLVVILWDWTEMKSVLSQIAYYIGLCSVESPVSFSPFSYNMTHCTFFSYCCWMHSAFYLRLLKKNINAHKYNLTTHLKAHCCFPLVLHCLGNVQQWPVKCTRKRQVDWVKKIFYPLWLVLYIFPQKYD